MKAGFSFYGALTYFIFYGYDHLVDPLRLTADPMPGRAWRALMAVTRLWMRPSGQPEPQISKPVRRPISSHVELTDELVPTGRVARREADAPSAAIG